VTRRLLVLIALAFAPVAHSADFALNAGAIEVVALPPPQHAGLYLYAGGSLAFVVPHAVLIPSLALEWSPDQLRGGLVLSLAVDFPLGDRLGVDLNLTLIHDQAGTDFAHALFFLGAGPGLTIFFGKQAISPYLSVFYGLNAPGWSLVPGINFSSVL